jgi:hypothetical protein
MVAMPSGWLIVPSVPVAEATLIALRSSVWIARTVIRAIGVWIELSALAGIGDHLLGRNRRDTERADKQYCLADLVHLQSPCCSMETAHQRLRSYSKKGAGLKATAFSTD